MPLYCVDLSWVFRSPVLPRHVDSSALPPAADPVTPPQPVNLSGPPDTIVLTAPCPFGSVLVRHRPACPSGPLPSCPLSFVSPPLWFRPSLWLQLHHGPLSWLSSGLPSGSSSSWLPPCHHCPGCFCSHPHLFPAIRRPIILLLSPLPHSSSELVMARRCAVTSIFY